MPTYLLKGSKDRIGYSELPNARRQMIEVGKQLTKQDWDTPLVDNEILTYLAFFIIKLI